LAKTDSVSQGIIYSEGGDVFEPNWIPQRLQERLRKSCKLADLENSDGICRKKQTTQKWQMKMHE